MTRSSGIPLENPLPSPNAHATIPKWMDFVRYKQGDPSVPKRMLTGYPRFVIHEQITQLAEILLHEKGQEDEHCMLLPAASYAHECRAYLLERTSPARVRQEQFSIVAKADPDMAPVDLHAVFYPNSNHKVAVEFWQQTGFGISIRLAGRCLDLLGAPVHPTLSGYSTPSRRHDHHDNPKLSTISTGDSSKGSNDSKKGCTDSTSSFSAEQTKAALRNRLADALAHSESPGQKIIHQDDVFLYPTGLAALWHAHKLLTIMRPALKYVCFGFSYMDTLSILEKWGPGCHFFGHDHDSNLKELESLLSSSKNVPPISALFCEIASNPYLQSPPMDRLRALADKYDFLIVVDNTIASSVNVDVLPYADIVFTSLGKYICGHANAMGGSLVFNPRMRHYQKLKATQIFHYEDTYFEEDVIVMERCSRDFTSRMRSINNNTNAVCEFLRSRSLLVPATGETFVIKNIFYPKWASREQYDICRLRTYADGQPAEDNFGGLFSLSFVSPLAARVFHDALPCAKGASFGANYTLASPYTILTHDPKRNLVAEYGVDENLIRVGLGLEDQAKLLEDFGFALREAEKAVRETGELL